MELTVNRTPRKSRKVPSPTKNFFVILSEPAFNPIYPDWTFYSDIVKVEPVTISDKFTIDSWKTREDLNQELGI